MGQAKDARAVLDGFRALVAKGATLRAMSAKLRVPRSTLYDRLQRAQLPLRRRALSPDRDRRIRRRVAKGEAKRAIMRAERVSFDAVQRRWREWLARQGAGPLPTSAWRCPTCGGKITTSYCVADGTPKPRSARTAERSRRRP